MSFRQRSQQCEFALNRTNVELKLVTGSREALLLHCLNRTNVELKHLS